MKKFKHCPKGQVIDASTKAKYDRQVEKITGELSDFVDQYEADMMATIAAIAGSKDMDTRFRLQNLRLQVSASVSQKLNGLNADMQVFWTDFIAVQNMPADVHFDIQHSQVNFCRKPKPLAFLSLFTSFFNYIISIWD